METGSFAPLIKQIRKLSSPKLEEQTERLAKREHQQGARLIAHLAEVSTRRLYRQQAGGSLFKYCTIQLGLTESCAALRIQVSRFCGRHPQILDALARQQMSLTVASKLAPHLTVGNRERLIADCSGMSKREVLEYLVHLAPKPAVNPGARRCPAAPAGEPAGETVVKPGSIEPCQPDLYNLRFAADKAFMDKLQRAAEVSGAGDAGRDMARILERALDTYLEKNDPRKRQERREKRAARKAHAEAEAVVEGVEVAAGGQGVACSRTISVPVRDRLLIRAEHQCEYRSSDGLRCSERSRLEIDHIVPWGLGGSNEEGNLRVLCAPHNRLHADRCYGTEFMDQIESARSMSAQQADSSQPAQRQPAGYEKLVRTRGRTPTGYASPR